MAKWWVVNKDSHALIALCDESERPLPSIGEDQLLVEVPEAVAPGNCKVLDTDGVLSLVDGSADKAGPRWSALRAARNAKLLECEYTQLADCSLGAPKIAEYVVYRQALKDLPANTVDPDNVIYPTKPE